VGHRRRKKLADSAWICHRPGRQLLPFLSLVSLPSNASSAVATNGSTAPPVVYSFGFAAPAPPRHLDSDVAFGDVRIACLRVHDRHDAGKPFGSHILYSVKKLEQTAPFPTKKKVNTVCL
jgi:hypothetical protein